MKKTPTKTNQTTAAPKAEVHYAAGPIEYAAAKLGATDEEMRTVIEHPMFAVMCSAIHQAAFGKGERHGGASIDFLDQPWAHYARMHGRGFLTGQAAKKLEEAANLRSGASFAHEMRGAMVYAAMAVLHEERSGADDHLAL